MKDNCIVCAMPENGKETENIEIPVKTVTEETLNFGIWEDSIYVMSYEPEEEYLCNFIRWIGRILSALIRMELTFFQRLIKMEGIIIFRRNCKR